MLKPADLDTVETLLWLDQHARPKLRDSGLRIALPVCGVDGEVVLDGWTATPWLEGSPMVGAWDAKADIARRLARAFSLIDPGQLPTRNDPWALADKAAWGGQPNAPLGDHPLAKALRPIEAPVALVHGDLAGNVLGDPQLLPAVIDLTLYARPVEWSVAVLAVDAVCFEGAPLVTLENISDDRNFPQYLARALLFRMITDVLLGGSPGSVYDGAATYVLEKTRES